MVNFNISNTVLNSEVFIIGLPDHINQLGYINYNNEDITKQIDTYRHHHLISSQLGKISSTLLPLKDSSKRLITVGLGNLKTLDYGTLLRAFGNLFQFFKRRTCN